MRSELDFERVPNRPGRRDLLRMTLGFGASVATGMLYSGGATATSGSQFLRTTANLNLRAKASSSGKILLVIPANASVENHGQSSNGYVKVTYTGTAGWAYSAYLEEATGGSDDPDVEFTGSAKTTAAANLRSGPSTGDAVLSVLGKGAVVDISDRVVGGYRYVDANGPTGWVNDVYLHEVEPGGPISLVTTTAVNLHASASMSAKVLKVAPKGATVIDYDLVLSNGFRGVDFNGVTGWIYDSYLREK